MSEYLLTSLLLTLIPILLYVLLNVKRITVSNGTKLPPSPTKLPLIGNLHQLGLLPHRSLHKLSDKYGPLMLLRLGEVPLLVVSSPDMAREVMKTQDHIFANRPQLEVIKQLLYNGKDIAFAPYGSYWRQARKITILHLLSSKKVQSYRRMREEEVALMVEEITQQSGLGLVNVSEAMNSLAKGFITRVCLGTGSRKEGWYQEIHSLVEECSLMMGEFHVGDFIPLLGWLSMVFGRNARARKIFKRVDVGLQKIVDDHINHSKDDANETSDLVDVLLSIENDPKTEHHFGKDNIKSILQDMLGAGTDSTHITMEWAMAEMVRNPRVMRKVKDEIIQVAGPKLAINEEDLTKMSYLKAVMKESLRLHPTGPLLVPRESTEETEIQGYRIPKKTMVAVNVWAIGRDPKVWENPEVFMPERFMGSPLDFMGHDFELTPFGAGRRVCPGIQFGVAVVELALANLVHRFDWKLPGNIKEEDLDMVETPGLTARKKFDLQLIALPK